MKRYFALAAISAALFCSCNGGNEPSADDSEATTYLTFRAILEDSDVAFKTTWSQTDTITVTAVKNGEVFSEDLRPSVVSSDGSTALLNTLGVIPADAQAYYAYAHGTGIRGITGTCWKTESMNNDACPGVLAGKADETKDICLRNIYSLLKISINTTKISYITLEGNDSEFIDRGNLVSFNDFSVTADPSANFASSRIIRKNITSAGDCHISLYPGLNLSKGYTITAYDQAGAVLSAVSSDESLCVESGRVYKAPELNISLKTKEFDATKILCSMAAISDVHIDKNNTMPSDKFRNALRLLQEQAKKDDADGIDAVLVDGDLTQNCYTVSSYNEVDMFKAIYEAAFDPTKVPMIYSIGNHDTYKQWSGITYSEAKNMSSRLGSNYFLTDIDKTLLDKYECRHCKVGNYHILCINPYSSSPVTYPVEAVTWLDNSLKTLTEENPEQYVIVLTHPMIHNTCYGSQLGTYWYTDALTPTLSKYPQVIVFGGHLHFPVNDPRSIWQGDFTSIGCGSVRYMAIESGGYEEMSSSTVMKDCNDVSSGHLLQIDESGNIRITRMFFSQSTTFPEPWVLSYPQEDKSHLQPYNFDRRRAANTAPKLTSVKADVTAISTTESLVTASFPSGQDDEFVHHYVLTLLKDGSTVVQKKILADFYRCAQPSSMKASWTQSMGNVTAGTYEIKLEAYDSWDAKSNTVTASFTAGGEAPKAAETYADIDFSSGKITDSKGKLEITNNGASIAKTDVTVSGTGYKVDAAALGAGKYVTCKFKEQTSSQEMISFVSKGFSVEAFYVDKSPGSGVHGIVCGTEYGGWGIATGTDSNAGIPYFVLGCGSTNTYRYVYANKAASTTDLVHVVGVFEAAASQAKIYVNGVLQNTVSTSGLFCPASGSDFNTFCLGNDVGSSVFPCTNVVMVDAKIYSGALTASEVKTAYANAVSSLK